MVIQKRGKLALKLQRQFITKSKMIINAKFRSKNGFIKEIRKYKPNVIFNALHGRYGEDGYIQLILENEKIKYTHSGIYASSVCINKLISKKLFLKNKIKTPKYIILKILKKNKSSDI